jgi:hypothetical protein
MSQRIVQEHLNILYREQQLYSDDAEMTINKIGRGLWEILNLCNALVLKNKEFYPAEHRCGGHIISFAGASGIGAESLSRVSWQASRL